jgi:thiol:disulfide interchange protein DsbA
VKPTSPGRRHAIGSIGAGLAWAAAATSAPAWAQPAPVRPSYEYFEIPAQPVATGARIEVVEFFWYGCPFCNMLQGPLESWLKRKPDDVELRRIPAIFRESWVAHARVFYVLESLGELPRLHQAVYRAVHAERENLTTAETSADWVGRNGIERARWLAAYNAPEIDNRIEQSKAATRAYGIRGTPSLVVDGRYVTSTGMSESVSGVITILDGLIGIARERRAAK